MTEPLEQPALAYAARLKWGEGLDAGFQIVPDVLFKQQQQLGLTPLDVVILLNISLHWWKAGDNPFPRPANIAKRIGVSTRTVERRLAMMEDKGLIKKMPSEKLDKGISFRRIDLSGLVHQLQRLARQEPGFGLRHQKAVAAA